MGTFNTYPWGLTVPIDNYIRDLHASFGGHQRNTGDATPHTAQSPTRVFYVDDTDGNDTAHDGLTPNSAFKTVTKGINAARCDAANDDAASIRTRNHQGWVLIAPGHYDEQILYDATHKDKLFGIHVIGLGGAVPGKDYGVCINNDAAISDSNGVVCFQGNANHFANLCIVCEEAIPAVHMASSHLGDNNLLENLVILGDGTNCTYGIEAGSMKGSWIKNCLVNYTVTAGIYVKGGADVYAIQGGIHDNQILMGGNGVGILVDSGVATTLGFIIDRNHVFCPGSGKGIDNNSVSNVLITDNYVVTGSGTPVETAGGAILNNHTYDGTNWVDPNPAANP